MAFGLAAKIKKLPDWRNFFELLKSGEKNAGFLFSPNY